ncbi:hypothetical protein [Ottowia sp. VDI28]|uniref:hypothetical protein n=1 Tax=Ottowia sp. VDI28 TaxID=3133968 RepID=UPI003C2D75BA
MATTSQQIIKRVFAPTALVGEVYARKRGTTGARFPLGNVLELELSHKEDVKTQPNMRRLGGGIHGELRRVTDVEIKMTLADINVSNWARASLGSARGVEGGTVSDEAQKAVRGALIRTAHMKPKNVVLTKLAGTGTATDEEHLNVDKGDLVALTHAGPYTNVTVRAGANIGTATPLTMASNYTVEATGIQIDAAAPGITNGQGIWVSYEYSVAEGVVSAASNYEVRAAGVFILENAPDFPDADDEANGASVTLDYEYDSYAVIEALVTKAQELELTFEGLNEADDGKPSIVDVWRASQGVAASIPLLGDGKFVNFPVTGAILEDDTKTGEGISKYYRVSKV